MIKFLTALSLVLVLACASSEPAVAPQPPLSPPPADLGPTGLQQGLPAQSGSFTANPTLKPAASKLFARYKIVSEPAGVGVFRETGDMIGLTPLTLELTSGRALKLTFLMKGYIITSQFLLPEPGDHELKMVMTPSN